MGSQSWFLLVEWLSRICYARIAKLSANTMQIKRSRKEKREAQRQIRQEKRDKENKTIEYLKQNGIYCCYICNGPFGHGKWAPSKDHVVPRSVARGLLNNVKWAHIKCNREKGNLNLEEFQARK